MFQTTSRGLDPTSFPLRLYEKAKRLGGWDPSALDFSRDRSDWAGLGELEQTVVLQLTSLFQAGEEAVTVDLLPLVLVVASEGRLEEELFLTTFLFEEGKHTQFFRRFLDEVAGSPDELERFHTPSYRRVFEEELPRSLRTLLTDRSPEAQARAAVTYTIIVEGVLAETGYRSYQRMLEQAGIMPGLREGLVRVKQDESRHIAYGIYLLARLAAEHDGVWQVIQERMAELLPLALAIVSETFDPYEEPPFGLTEEEFVEYATSQFAKRLERIERARVHGVGALALEELET